MSLRDTTSILLRAPDVGTWVKLADNYIQAYNRLPDQFVLPAEHAILLPLIESFANDANAFAMYIRALRDGSDGTAKAELHAMYRTISVRALQVERRTRIRKAVVILLPQLEERIGRLIPYKSQLRVAEFVEKRWGAMRVATASTEREALTAKRLSSEERTIVYDDFWKHINDCLDNKVVDLGGNEFFEELVKEVDKL